MTGPGGSTTSSSPPPAASGAAGNLALSFDGVALALGSRTILSGIDLTLAPGEVLGVLGPNGVGKTTLLRAAAGLVVPATGRIRLGETELAAWDRQALARALAFLPQDRIVHWPVTVARLVGLGRLPHRTGPAAGDSEADRAAIARALMAADVGHLAERTADALSGGERARVLIARTLAQDARILVADEPTAGLDPAHQLRVMDLIARHAREGGSVLMALHDLSLALRVCTRVVVLQDGAAVAIGPPRAVLTPERLARSFGLDARVVEFDGVPIVLSRAALP